MTGRINENTCEVNLEKNIKLCLDFGYGTLKVAKNDIEYRNAIVSVHNGVELLMKLYLKSKDENLIYSKIDQFVLMYKRTDLIKEVPPKKERLKTIIFSDCIDFLSYFQTIPEPELQKLNSIRNNCVHYEYTVYKHEIKKILIGYIYPFIKGLVEALGLSLTNFINENCIESLERLKRHIDDEMNNKFIEKIEIAKKHYYDELNQDERNEKKKYQSYDLSEPTYKITPCPACKNDSLLKIHLKITSEAHERFSIIRKNLVLKDLTCHHCGLIIDERDLLLLQYVAEEKSLSDKVVYHYDCPENDCPEDDCPEDDCPEDDCPEYDCPEDDCPEDDCPEDDCPE
jgi:hypothetical protein